MDKNFVKFIYKLIELSDKERHIVLRDQYIVQTVNLQKSTLPDKIEFDRERGIVTTTFKRDSNGKLLDEKSHTYQINSFDQEILKEAKYHFEQGFFEFFEHKNESLTSTFVKETLPKLLTGQAEVNSQSYYDNYPKLKKTLVWIIDRMSNLSKPKIKVGREPDHDYELMIDWFNEFASMKEFQKSNGEPHLTKIDNAIIDRFKEISGFAPTDKTVRKYRKKFKLS
tara:strand:+ start:21406 stop:22080 length:675 start_codon:yes stop_codon:yes gene_type:complete